MEETLIRHIIYSDEFEEYYASMNEQLKKKYDYALQIVKSQYVVSSKIVKSLENTDFYELRISISSNEYRTILLAVDHDNFIQSKNVLLLNSFLKKDTKQYKAEIKKAENIVKRYLEDWICWNLTKTNLLVLKHLTTICKKDTVT